MPHKRVIAASATAAVLLGLCALRAHTPSGISVVSADAVGTSRIFPQRANRSALRDLFPTTTAAPVVTAAPVTIPPVSVPPVTIPVATTSTTVRPTTTTTVRIRSTTTSTSAAAPTPAPGGCIGHRMSMPQAHACWDGLLAKYSWSQSKAFSVLYCESTGNSSASNGVHHGLFQIEDGPYDPDANVALAWDYYSRRGWQPWACA